MRRGHAPSARTLRPVHGMETRAVTARTPRRAPGTSPRPPSRGYPSTSGPSPRCPSRAPPPAPARSSPPRPASTAPSCARTSPTSAATAPAGSATTSTTCATRSPARSASPRTGRSSSSASATSATRWPTTPASAAAASGSSRCWTPTRNAPTSWSPGVDVRPFDDLEEIVARERRRDRRDRHPRGRRAGRRRPDGRVRHHQHPQLRADRAERARRASTSARSTSPSSCRSSPTTSSARPTEPRHDPRPSPDRLARRSAPRRERRPRMSVLVVGISHNSAPVSLLERVALPADGGVHKLVQAVAHCEHVTEATVISTCNRLEIYADVDRFHGSVEELSRLLVERAGEATEAMLPHLYVHYDDGAVSHLFQVAAGLDSMAVGEGQILGQTREALRARPGARHRRPRPQRALPAGAARRQALARRDRHRPRRAVPGHRRARPLGRRGRRRWPASGSLVVGAGAMAGLATATVVRLRRRRGHRRQPQPRPRRPARRGVRRPPGAAVRARRRARRAPTWCIACAGATGLLVTLEMVGGRAPRRPPDGRSSTSRCRTTSTRRSPRSPASP